jgi:hypothetical protein
MTISQKTAWVQSIIFAALIIGWGVLFLRNGTIFYWQDEAMKMTFLWMNAAALAIFVIMQVFTAISKGRAKAAVDERDRAVFRRATLWAVGISYSVVIALLVIVAAVYMEKGNTDISVYLPLFIVFTGWLALSLAQPIAALIMYGRKVNHG